MKDYSFIATNKPVNRTAGIVLQKGEHFEEPEYKNLFKAPLPLGRYKGNGDLTGKRFYRFTVIGFVRVNGQGKSRWLLKCDCGNYTIRSKKAIKKLNKTNGKCPRCSYLDYIKSEEFRERSLEKLKRSKG